MWRSQRKTKEIPYRISLAAIFVLSAKSVVALLRQCVLCHPSHPKKRGVAERQKTSLETSRKKSLSVSGVKTVFTGRNEVVAKVMFLLVSVILLTGEWVSCWDTSATRPPPPGADTPWEQTPLGADTPWEQTPPREQTPPQSRLILVELLLDAS